MDGHFLFWQIALELKDFFPCIGNFYTGSSSMDFMQAFYMFHSVSSLGNSSHDKMQDMSNG